MNSIWGSHMKFHFVLFVCLLSSASLKADIVKINIDSGLYLKVNSDQWNYQYVKAMKAITPHIVESKNRKDLKVIIQKETHTDQVRNKKTFVAEKCKAANQFYQDSKQGSAKSIQIKNTDVCLIKMSRNNSEDSFQIIYPVKFNKNAYELMSFAWKVKGSSALDEVSKLVGDNL